VLLLESFLPCQKVQNEGYMGEDLPQTHPGTVILPYGGGADRTRFFSVGPTE
jgi:hypothetical protein